MIKYLIIGIIMLAGPASAQTLISYSAPHVLTNADLAAAATEAYAQGVWRDDFATGNGAPPLFYYPSASACSLNSGAGDNGSQVASADGKCWLARFPADDVDAREWACAVNGATDDSACLNAAEAWATSTPGKVALPGVSAIANTVAITASYPSLVCPTISDNKTVVCGLKAITGGSFTNGAMLTAIPSVRSIDETNGSHYPTVEAGSNLHWSDDTGYTSGIATPPQTWTDTQGCTAGSITVDASYIYVCTSANTVKRAALSAF